MNDGIAKRFVELVMMTYKELRLIRKSQVRGPSTSLCK